ncbi:hypothetical protein [Rhizobium sp. GN54]|uniref:hypothetical protein n=1 Tax=Rhizobium sp. GN54 TaxID=2898150 RepID=UPI001E35BBEB|nr:hypothetical protein [Rhizobium sp. GN54]MCD2180678.1 hypothetical protein [Rhizobium sp. GN54]
MSNLPFFAFGLGAAEPLWLSVRTGLMLGKLTQAGMVPQKIRRQGGGISQGKTAPDDNPKLQRRQDRQGWC